MEQIRGLLARETCLARSTPVTLSHCIDSAADRSALLRAGPSRVICTDEASRERVHKHSATLDDGAMYD